MMINVVVLFVVTLRHVISWLAVPSVLLLCFHFVQWFTNVVLNTVTPMLMVVFLLQCPF